MSSKTFPVTIFGFSKEKTPQVLDILRKKFTILKYEDGDGEWIHIFLSAEEERARLLRQDKILLEEVGVILGVCEYLEEEADDPRTPGEPEEEARPIPEKREKRTPQRLVVDNPLLQEAKKKKKKETLVERIIDYLI